MSDDVPTYTRMQSPLGAIFLVADAQERLIQASFERGRGALSPPREWREEVPPGGVLAEAITQLEAYFDGRLQRFELPLGVEGTPFQRQVWRGLQAIPYGQTRSYGELAVEVDCPRGARAVGNANGKNPIPVIIPCHRVIAADGKLGGYSPGLDFKRSLLHLEKRCASKS